MLRFPLVSINFRFGERNKNVAALHYYFRVWCTERKTSRNLYFWSIFVTSQTKGKCCQEKIWRLFELMSLLKLGNLFSILVWRCVCEQMLFFHPESQQAVHYTCFLSVYTTYLFFFLSTHINVTYVNITCQEKLIKFKYFSNSVQRI